MKKHALLLSLLILPVFNANAGIVNLACNAAARMFSTATSATGDVLNKWYVSEPVFAYGVYDGAAYLLSDKQVIKPRPTQRPSFSARLYANVTSPWYWVKKVFQASLKSDWRQKRTEELGNQSDRNYFPLELGKRLVTDVAYEAAAEGLYKTGIADRVNALCNRVIARFGTPPALISCMAAGVLRGLVKTTIMKTIDSFDSTMQRPVREDLGFRFVVKYDEGLFGAGLN